MRRLTVRRLCVVLAHVACFALPAMADQTARKQVIEIAVTDGKVHSESAEKSGGVPVIRVRQGRTVALRWTSDIAMTIHLHGYNIETRVPRNGEAIMHLVARATGRFPIERHGRNGYVTLLYLEVRP
jgi:FtsP/CotA-like multicopper oxidase with cupredoxin domain